MKRCLSLLFLCTVAVAFTGCPRPDGGNGNDNEAPIVLTDAQEQAIERGMIQIRSLIEVFSTLDSFADPRLDLDMLGPANLFGTCPIVSYLRGTGEINTLITLDFGGGCATLQTGMQNVSGLTATSVNLATRVATIDFTTLVFAGNIVQGQFAPVSITETASGINLNGSMTLNVAGAGQFIGDFDVTLSLTGRITINFTLLSVDGGPPNQITLTGVIADPGLTSNLLPFDGAAQIDIPAATGMGTVQAALTFTTQTALDGTVGVQVGGQSTDFQVPGLIRS